MQVSPQRQKPLQHGFPLALQPILRAYVLGYASSTAPRLLTLLLTHLSRRRKSIDENPHYEFCRSFISIVRGGLHPKRFATFCAALVSGSILLQVHSGTLYVHGMELIGYSDLSERCSQAYLMNNIRRYERGESSTPAYIWNYS